MQTKPTTNGLSEEMRHTAGVSERRARVRHALMRVFLLSTGFLCLVATCAVSESDLTYPSHYPV